jgi:paraquat-inducible protein A
MNAERGLSDGAGKSPGAIEKHIACPDCGTVQYIPPLPRRATAVCVTCGGGLESTAGRSTNAALACSLSMLLLLLPSILFRS